LLKQLTKAVLERALQGEMREHLGYSKMIRRAATAATAGTA
jgi:transposase-like protein